MSKEECYLDHAASSLMHPSVSLHLYELFTSHIGNAASIHRSGVIASTLLEKARIQISTKLNCQPEEVYFTSGATEANNLAIKGIAHYYKDGPRKEILISSIEHSSVREAALSLEEFGYKIKIIPVDNNGIISTLELEKLINPNVLLVSILHANNEIGVIQDLKSLSKIIKSSGAYFHSDGAQAFCKTPLDLNSSENGVDLYSMSSHKIHGPKGVGALFIREGIKLNPQIVGGGQESAIRSGTTPVELISAMAKASQLFTPDVLDHLKNLESFCSKLILEKLPTIRINSFKVNGLPNIQSLHIPGLSGKICLQELDKNGIRVSVGSACHSGKKNPSHVLKAIGHTDNEAFEVIRVSFGIENSKEDIEYFINSLVEIIKKQIG